MGGSLALEEQCDFGFLAVFVQQRFGVTIRLLTTLEHEVTRGFELDTFLEIANQACVASVG